VLRACWTAQGKLGEWVTQLHDAVKGLGESLDAEGSQSPGAFVMDCMRDITARDKPASAVKLSHALV
jgi:hypothetical protein